MEVDAWKPRQAQLNEHNSDVLGLQDCNNHNANVPTIIKKTTLCVRNKRSL